MKKIMMISLLLSLSFSITSFAREGGKCGKEMKDLGCGHPREVGFDSFHTCVEENIDKLSSDCQEQFKQRKEGKGKRDGVSRGKKGGSGVTSM